MLPQNIAQFVIRHLHSMWSWKRTPCPYNCSRYIKKGPLYFTHATQKCYLLKEIQLFHFVWKFASAWKSISHCKLFEVIWFYIVLCLHIKVVKGPLWYIFLLCFEKHMTCSRACGSRVVHQLLNKTMQKLSANASKRGPATSLKKGGPETTALLAFPNIHPALNNIQKKNWLHSITPLSWLKSCITS